MRFGVLLRGRPNSVPLGFSMNMDSARQRKDNLLSLFRPVDFLVY